MAKDTDPSIAEELSAKQREISVAEFFEQNRQMLGFGSQARAMVTAVKEGVDNAIDAAEDAEILPAVYVTITQADGHYKLTIRDNGPGITKEQVPKVFGKLLYGSRFSKRVQRRGQQGIGISAAVLYAQLTTGRPAEIVSKVSEQDQGEYFKVGIDTDENTPEIRESESVSWEHDTQSGTSITIYLEANFRARSSLHKYIEHTAIVNPHATIELDEPDRQVRYERTVDELPEQPTEINPHPHGIEFGTLRSLIEVTDSHSISGFLQSEFTRVGQTTADDIIDAFMDRVHGRYLTWDTPDPDAEIPIDAVENAAPYSPEVTENTTGEDSEDPEDTPDPDVTTLPDYIEAHVNRKAADATTAFATRVSDALHSEGRVSWITVQETIESVSDDVEGEYGTTFGETVREKAARAAWDVIRTTREQTITSLVDGATSDRKTSADIAGFATALTEGITTTSDFTDSLTKHEVTELVEGTADTTADTIDNAFGGTAQENVFDALWDGMDRSTQDPPLLRELDTDRDLADELHTAMQEVSVMAPPSHCLSPIGEDALEKGMGKVYNADFYTTSTRDASAHSGDPFLVEAGIAYGGDIEDNGDVELLRFANRVPLVYQQGACCITSVVSGIRWNNYKLSDKGSGLPQGPVAIVVHVASTNVPFTSESKDAVASVDVIEDEIERAVRDVARELKGHLKEKRSLQKRQRKQDTIAEVLPAFSKKISEMTGNTEPSTDQSLAQIMNNVFVRMNAGDDSDTSEVTVVNYDNRASHTPTVTIQVDTDPGSIGTEGITVTANDGTWTVTWDPSVTAGNRVTETIGIPLETVTSLDVDALPEEKVTTAVIGQ